MPRVLEDYGPTLLVELDDGTTQEVISDAYRQAFPQLERPEPDYNPAEDIPSPAPPLGVQAAALENTAPPPAEITMPVDDLSQAQPPPLEEGPVITMEPDVLEPTPLHSPLLEGSPQTLPQYTQAIRQYGTEQLEAQGKLGDIESERLGEVASALDEHHRRATELEERQRASESEGRERAAQKLENFDRLTDEWANTTVDRDRLYKRMDTGDRILAGIGMALSGLGMALQKRSGPNPGVQMMMKAIEDDVADQRATIAQKGEALRKKRGLYAEFLKQLDSEQAAYHMAIAQSAQQANRRLEIIKTRSQSEAVKAQAGATQAELKQHISDNLERARQLTVQETMRGLQMRQQMLDRAAKLRGRGGGRAGSADALNRLARSYGKDAKRELMVEVDPGAEGEDLQQWGFQARTTKQATELQAAREAVENLNRILSKEIALRNKIGWSSDTWKEPEHQQAKVLQGMRNAAIKDALDLGAIQEADVTLFGELFVDPTRYQDVQPALKEIREAFNAGYGTKLRASGYRGKWQPPKIQAAPAPTRIDLYKELITDETDVGPVPLADRIAAAEKIEADAIRGDEALERARQDLELALTKEIDRIHDELGADIQVRDQRLWGEPLGRIVRRARERGGEPAVSRVRKRLQLIRDLRRRLENLEEPPESRKPRAAPAKPATFDLRSLPPD